jgi:hypothetical protein
VYVVVFWRSTNPLSVVVVVVLEVAGGATTTGAGAGAVSTTGAGLVVASTFLWYEKHPAAIKLAAAAAGIIAMRFKILMYEPSIGNLS